MLKKKILIVDDDKDIVEIIASSLKNRGLLPKKYKVVILKAYDVDEAIKISWQEKPDLMVLDYLLPSGIGIKVLNAVANGAIRAIDMDRVIIITGDTRDHQGVASAYGVAKYLLKPFKMRVLAEIVKELLKKTRLDHNTS